MIHHNTYHHITEYKSKNYIITMVPLSQLSFSSWATGGIRHQDPRSIGKRRLSFAASQHTIGFRWRRQSASARLPQALDRWFSLFFRVLSPQSSHPPAESAVETSDRSVSVDFISPLIGVRSVPFRGRNCGQTRLTQAKSLRLTAN